MNKALQELISNEIRRVLPDAEVELASADDVHIEARVRSAQFRELKRLEQHRLVMNALGEVIASNRVHAVQLKTEAL